MISFRTAALVPWLLCIAFASVNCVSKALAGGGPENVILVVNQNSPTSLAVANLYVELRQIPPSNVVYLNLPFGPDVEQITLEQFRDKILKPITEEIHARRLDSQIDYIIYSADFPTAIDVNQAVAKLRKEQPNLTPEQNKLFAGLASINSMTYFAGAVLGDSTSFLSLDGNWYMRQKIEDAIGTAFSGDDDRNFRSALVALQAGNYENALEFLKPLAKTYPLQFAARLQLVRCYAGLGQPKETAAAIDVLAKIGWGHRKTLLDFKELSKVADDADVKKALELIPDEVPAYVSSKSFRRLYLWGRNGGLNNGTEQGRNYLLSTVLAVTRHNGTSLADALAYLRASAAADHTRPQGDVYFTLTSDVRTTTRQPGFESAIAGLKQLGLGGYVVKNDLPMGKKKVLGAMIGEKAAKWPACQSELLPGGIVDNLTSLGGVMKGNSHTPATEFLKWGAAGSSGTVVEPYAVQAKFAHPMIMVHYARGCSLAEAYYQSVHGPFQLLIVGDALCQPFASPVPFTVEGLIAGSTVKGKISLTVATADPAKIDRYELFLDGIRSVVNSRLGKINFDADKISDGYHELRIVAVASGPIETQSRQIIPFIVDHHGGKVELSLENSEYSQAEQIKVTAISPALGEITIYQNSRLLGSIAKSGESLSVPASRLGAGKCQMFAVALFDGKRVQSEPITLIVK